MTHATFGGRVRPEPPPRFARHGGAGSGHGLAMEQHRDRMIYINTPCLDLLPETRSVNSASVPDALAFDTDSDQTQGQRGGRFVTGLSQGEGIAARGVFTPPLIV